MRKPSLSLTLVLGALLPVSAFGGMGGCGGEQAAAPPPEAPPAAASAAAPSAGEALPAQPEAEFHGPMPPVTASTLVADVQAIGLDPKALPPLSKLDPKLLRKIMPSFSKSLGVKCAYCHNLQDFAAPTPKKKLAEQMWAHFVMGLAMNDGSPVYCDSCHQGRAITLDRGDKKALSKWMDANYVKPLTRRDGQEHGCTTCHGDPFEGDIFGKVWHVE